MAHCAVLVLLVLPYFLEGSSPSWEFTLACDVVAVVVQFVSAYWCRTRLAVLRCFRFICRLVVAIWRSRHSR